MNPKIFEGASQKYLLKVGSTRLRAEDFEIKKNDLIALADPVYTDNPVIRFIVPKEILPREGMLDFTRGSLTAEDVAQFYLTVNSGVIRATVWNGLESSYDIPEVDGGAYNSIHRITNDDFKAELFNLSSSLPKGYKKEYPLGLFNFSNRKKFRNIITQ